MLIGNFSFVFVLLAGAQFVIIRGSYLYEC